MFAVMQWSDVRIIVDWISINSPKTVTRPALLHKIHVGRITMHRMNGYGIVQLFGYLAFAFEYRQIRLNLVVLGIFQKTLSSLEVLSYLRDKRLWGYSTVLFRNSAALYEPYKSVSELLLKDVHKDFENNVQPFTISFYASVAYDQLHACRYISFKDWKHLDKGSSSSLEVIKYWRYFRPK